MTSISHDLWANKRVNTALYKVTMEEVHLCQSLLFIPYNVQTPFYHYLFTSMQEAVISVVWQAWLFPGKHTNWSPESHSDSTWLIILRWPLLAVSKTSSFICACLSWDLMCSVMLQSSSWLPVFCTSHSWVSHKFLALLTPRLMNIWNPMNPHFILHM